MNRKTYLITGASSDVGIDLIRNINKHQQQSIILAQYRTQNDELMKLKCENENSIYFMRSDLSNIDNVKNLIKHVQENHDIPSHIVHLPASKFGYHRLKDIEWERCLIDVEIQVHSILEILKAFLPTMVKRKEHNKVVFMLSSNIISIPEKYTCEYNMVKYMLLGLMKSLASDYRGKSININAVSPSMMDTKFLSDIDPRFFEVNGLKKDMATVNQVVPAIEFLLSDASNYISGENINISNGMKT